MTEEKIRNIAKETFIENVMNNLDSSIIFTYIQTLEEQNKKLKEANKKAIEYLKKETVSVTELISGIGIENRKEYLLDILNKA